MISTSTSTTPAVPPNDTRGKHPSLVPSLLLYSLLVYSPMNQLIHLFFIFWRNSADNSNKRRQQIIFLLVILPQKYWWSSEDPGDSPETSSHPSDGCYGSCLVSASSLYGTCWHAKPAGSYKMTKSVSVTFRVHITKWDIWKCRGAKFRVMRCAGLRAIIRGILT